MSIHIFAVSKYGATIVGLVILTNHVNGFYYSFSCQ